MKIETQSAVLPRHPGVPRTPLPQLCARGPTPNKGSTMTSNEAEVVRFLWHIHAHTGFLMRSIANSDEDESATITTLAALCAMADTLFLHFTGQTPANFKASDLSTIKTD